MKWRNVLVACVVCGLLMGCEEAAKESKTAPNLDVELVNTLNNVGVENAIITQHTLYPYHFTGNSEKLNELGVRDLGVLAKHLVEYPGTLNVRRGETGADLYEARVAYVVNRLKEAGVETNRMSLSDGMPGGSGMASERVITILQKEGQTSGGTSTSTRSGSTSGGMISR